MATHRFVNPENPAFSTVVCPLNHHDRVHKLWASGYCPQSGEYPYGVNFYKHPSVADSAAAMQKFWRSMRVRSPENQTRPRSD